MKIKYLIPMLSLTALTPAVTCLVSCGDRNIKGQPIEMQLTSEDEGDSIFLYESSAITLSQGSTYTIIANLSQLTKFSEADKLNIWVRNPLLYEEGEGLDDYMDVQEFIVNGKSLSLLTQETKDEGGWVIRGDFLSALPKKGEMFKMEGKVYITFKAKKNLDNPVILVLANDS